MINIDLGGNWADELLEQLQPSKKSELELLGDIQAIVKKSDERNYGDGEREF